KLHDVCTGGLADLGDGVDEGDLGGQKRIGGDLHQLGGGQVRDQERGAGLDGRGVDLAGHLIGGGTLADAHHDAVRGDGVLHRVPLAEELRVPRDLHGGAGVA